MYPRRRRQAIVLEPPAERPLLTDRFERGTFANEHWTNRDGSWAIHVASQKANPSSAGTRAIATVDFGVADVRLQAEFQNSSANGIGFVLSYIDAQNYVFVYIQPVANLLTIRQRVANVDSTLVNDTSVPYVLDAVLEVRKFGRKVQAFYNGNPVGLEATVNAIFDGVTEHGLFSTGVGSIYRADNFKFYDYSNGSQAVELVRTASNKYIARVRVINAGVKIVQEWGMEQNATTSGWFIGSSRILDLDDNSVEVEFDGSGMSSAYEYAFLLGKDTDISSSFGYVGSVHNNESLNGSLGLTVDGDAVTVATNHVVIGNRVVFSQNLDIINQSDGLTVGYTDLIHTFDRNSVHIAHDHTFTLSGYEYYSFYSAMLPALDTATDTYQVDGFPEATIVNDGGPKHFGSEVYRATLSDSGHDYRLQLSLPTGDPGSPGGWNANDNLKIWVSDRSDGVTKIYVDYNSISFALREAVADSSHEQIIRAIVL